MILSEALHKYTDFDEKIVVDRNGNELLHWFENDKKYKASVICVVPRSECELEIMIDYVKEQ